MAYVRTKPSPHREPPLNESTPLGWLKVNLFDTLFSSVLTIFVLIAIFFSLKGLLTWGVFDGVWFAETRRECFKISIRWGVLGRDHCLDGQYFLWLVSAR